MLCLSDLQNQLDALLPVQAEGYVRNAVRAAIGDPPHVQTRFPPLVGSVAVLDSAGNTVAGEHYTVNYVTGRIDLPDTELRAQFLLSYRYSLAAEFVLQALRDLGRQLPRRAVERIGVRAGTGVADLPDGFLNLLEVREIVEDCCSPCRCAEGCFDCSACSIFVSGDQLVTNPPVCEDTELEICYLGGYPLDDCRAIVGLTPELADLVLLKAQALAYSSPQMALTLAGLAQGQDARESSQTTTKVTTKSRSSCKDETTTTTTTGSAAASGSFSIFSASRWLDLAQHYQTLYDQAIAQHTGVAHIHGRACYRQRLMAAG